MNRLENLPEIAQRGLGGLTADHRLLQQIKLAAANGRAPSRRVRWQPVLAGCVALALCVCVGIWVSPLFIGANTAGSRLSSEVMGSRAAGGTDENNFGALVSALDLTASGVTISGAQDAAATYRNLFVPERDDNFPLILVGGAAYRMLISPTNMDQSLLGESLGVVTEYTLEPALSTGGGLVSNIVNADDTVYAVKDMQGAMAAAYVKGNLRVFQRVSFAGTAILGNETLTATLAAAKHITAMELTGSGIVDDPATAQSLMQTMLSNAVYESASVGGGDTRSLLIGLDNGLLMQLMVGDDTLSACGTWSCPEFFEAYEKAVAAE